MYSTCLFCHQPLGRNEVLEAFPVGRRLAYDAARGRLWVVCRRCERWNLTPLESRWEAIEDAERAFRATRLRVSTDQVGLARLGDGLELVRIGAPLRPELAAWRYGDQFGRRWRRHLVGSAAVAVGVGGMALAGPVMGLVSLGALSPVLSVLNLVHLAAHSRRGRPVSIPGQATPLLVRPGDMGRLRLMTDRNGGFLLRVSGVRPGRTGESGPTDRAAMHELAGRDALRVAAALMPRFNRNGASHRVVEGAVSLLEDAHTPEQLFARVAESDRARFRAGSWRLGDPGIVHRFPTPVKLALEMAAHEEAERRALEGELAELERAWRDAEEVAAIADDLVLPPAVRGAFAQLKARGASARVGQR